MPVAAIIAGVVGVASTVVSAVGASSTAKAAEEEAERQRKFEEEEAKKTRGLKTRELNQNGLQYLAQQRQQAQAMSANRSFTKDAMTALRSLPAQTQAPAPVAPPTQAPMPQRQTAMSPQPIAPPIAPQVPQVGLKTTTIGRGA